MKSIQLFSCIITSFLFQSILIGQDQVRIMDRDDDSAGRLKTQLYQLDGTELTKLRGKSPQVEVGGKQVEFVLKLKDLRWIEDKGITDDVKIERSEITINEPKYLQIASSPSSYQVSPEADSEADIKFRVLKNGSYSLKIPFTAGRINGQYVQTLKVSGLSSSGSGGTPVGSIADLKKEWRKVDKKSVDDVEAFISKYENNDIAKEERLIAIAERTLMRIQKREVVENEEEEVLWNKIGDGQDEEMLREFLNKFPDSKYAEAAKAKLGLDANVLITSENETRSVVNTLTKLVDNVYNLDVSHLEEVEVIVSHPDEIEIFDTGGNLYDLKVKGSKKYQITVNESSTGEQFDFDLDNRFKPQLDRDGGNFVFAIEGGVSPYTVEFTKVGEDTPLLEARFEALKADTKNEVEVTQKMLKSSGMDGKYDKVAIRDFTTQAVSSFPIDITVSPSKISSQLLIGLLLGGLILGGAFMFFRSKRQNKTRKAYREKAKVFQQTQKLETMQVAETVVKASVEKSKENATPKKITITKPARKFVPANGGAGAFKSSGKMKITKREVKGGRLTGEEFVDVLKDDKYAFLDLTELWPDSAIKELYVSKECIKDLGKFLKEENLDKAIAEMEGAIPEVGGFLMGYHQQNEAGHIRVTMDEFVPFVPEYHDVFKIEIGTATLVQELGDAQDTHPDKDVIGWFHTHPGHGLFLSNSDLSVQRHFPQKFQIAMEIDSLTDTLDTAFFTRKMDGTINNVEHRKKGAKWFSWKKIEKI